MLETISSGTHRRLKTRTQRGRLGKCLICGERVRKIQEYVTTSEGYSHRKCLSEWRGD